MLERLTQFHGKRGWLIFGVLSLAITVLIPVLNGLPKSFPLSVPDSMIPLMGKFLCFGMAAIAMDLIWGYTGILSLGHSLFFALGGYAMGMYLMRSIAGEGVYRSNLPDFMVFLDWKELPWYWHGFQSFWFAMAMVVVVPGLLAFVFGWFAFRSRIKGVYLSIVTQALTYAAMLLFFQNATGFGGNNGLTDFKRLLGHSLQAHATKRALYVATAIALVVTYLIARFVVTSKLGRVLRAVRDAELKTRFCGYESTRYKTFVWTLSAVLCALAGALYVPQVGIINPSEMQPSNSIELAIWAAVGGRGTLIGPLIGALFLNGAKSFLTAAFPSAWLYVLGGIFVLVTLFLPRGILGLGAFRRVRRAAATPGEAPVSAVAEAAPAPPEVTVPAVAVAAVTGGEAPAP
ncbi:MAG TPA: urea ABC transporter permease subunit UrtC [Polyangia bacterium]